MGCTSSSAIQGADSPQLRHLPKVIFVTGAPGSGKRTQVAKMVKKYHFNHLSVLNCLKTETER